MKMFGLFFLVLGLVLSAPSETGSDPSTTPTVEFSLHVNPAPVAKQTDNSVKYHVSFDLAIKNNGTNEYKIPSPASQLWNVVVFQRDSEKVLKWNWKDTDAISASLAAGNELKLAAEWDSANDANSGSYAVTATFLPTGSVTIKNFTLPPPQMNADILYTGRLMGYYRMPDKQKFEFANQKTADKDKDPICVFDKDRASPDAHIFFDNFGPGHYSEHQIRVSMGDNFAPNYFGRAFAEANGRDPEETEKYGASKGIYYWDTGDSKWKPPAMDSPSNPQKHLRLPEILSNIDDVRTGRGTIPTDNVACFLAYAHYDAIVPGMMDFHFGVERIRELARFLASIPTDTTKKNDDLAKDGGATLEPVQMLAANLMIRTSWAKDLDPVPDSAKPELPFVTKYQQKSSADNAKHACSPAADSSLEVTNIKDNDFVFPWMQFVRIEAKGCTRNFIVHLCEADGKNPDDFLDETKHCKKPIKLSLREDQTAKKGDLTGKGTRKLVYRFMPSRFDVKKCDDNLNSKECPDNLLVPGNHYAICVFETSETPSPDSSETSSSDSSRPYCVRFSVYTPFFQYPDWPKRLYLYPDWSKEGGKNGKGQPYTNPALYKLKNDEPGLTPVVIFGVVGPKMLENIGADNYSWQTVETSKRNPPWDSWNKQYKTQVFITDPIAALTELQQYFEQDYCSHHDGKPFHGIRVLLAQMRPEQARELAEHLPKSMRFDVVISAADNVLASPSQRVHMEPAMTSDAGKGDGDKEEPDNLKNTACQAPPNIDLNHATFVMVPARHDAKENRSLHARKLQITSDGHTYWDYDLSGESLPVTPATKSASKQLESLENNFWNLVHEQICKRGNANGCNTKMAQESKDSDDDDHLTALQQLALAAIRDKVHADVALLQEKDFYSHGLKDYLQENCMDKDKCDLYLQQILERIIWKGDFIDTLSVTGSVLKTVLKKSDGFAETEKAGYIPIEEPGWQLVTLGVKPDPNSSGNYLINGRPLDPNALYTVATSDFIALGDTGYPELATPPVGDPDPPASPHGKVYTVSAVTCNFITWQTKRKDTPSNIQKTCNQDIPAKDFPDRAADRKPDDARAVNTNLQKFHAWTFLRHRHGQLTAHLPATSKAEAIQNAWQKKVEDDTNWNWSFDQLSIGFTGLSHNGTGEEVSRKFSGVLSPAAAAPHSHSWDWDANSKFTFYHPMSDWFVSDTLQYSSQFTAQVPGPRSETQIRNQFVLEGGNYFHLHSWRSKELPQLSLALYGHFETAVGSPITTLQIASSTSPLVFDQGRTYGLLGRSGLRWENRKSYIEAGLEGGEILNAIRQFNVLVAPGGPTVPCQLEALVSLTTCINKFNQDHPATPVTNTSVVDMQRNPQPRYGAYWTMKVTVPINDTVSYNFQDLSDYFFLSGNDNSADARFRHQLIHTLKFMVLPNLSFEPTYTIYLYENKLDYNFLLQQQYSIKINYSFNFSNWHERNRQLRYKKP